MKLSHQLTSVLAAIEAVHTSADHYAFLPEIKETVERMIADQNAPSDIRERHAAALGRLVMEDFNFTESELGGRLLALSDSYAGY